MTLRYADKFESSDGATSFTFPTYKLEWQSRQKINLGLAQPVAGNYAHDFDVDQKAPSQETFRWLDWQSSEADLETNWDLMNQKLYNIGQGKLWLLNSDATRRWAYARLDEMPQVSVGPKQFHHLPVIVKFVRLSDWFGETSSVSGPTTVTTSPRAITVNNPGNAAIKNVTILIEANTALGFSNLVITNTTNGYSITTTRDSAADTDELEYDCGAWTAKFNGANDFSKVTLGSLNKGFFRLEPGDNELSITCDGTPNYDITFSGFAAYH